jgi:hypothetical protein
MRIIMKLKYGKVYSIESKDQYIGSNPFGRYENECRIRVANKNSLSSARLLIFHNKTAAQEAKKELNLNDDFFILSYKTYKEFRHKYPIN